MEIYQINTGWIKMKRKFALFSDEIEENSKYPVLVYLIKLKDKLILFDTGLSAQQSINIGPFKYFVELIDRNELSLDKQLNLIGYSIDNIDIVVNSHLHYDHCSGNHLFKNKKKIFIQKDELTSYEENKKNPMYSKELSIENIDFNVLDGEYQLLDSPKMVLVPSPGHSKGHQILLIETDDNLILISADCFYEKQGELYPILTSTKGCDEEYSCSLQKIKEILGKRGDKKITLLTSHDLKFESKIMDLNFQIIRYNLDTKF